MLSAIVLAGGYATRLRPLSLTKPKALLPVLDKPILDYVIDNLISNGIDKIYLSLRVMADKIIDRYKDRDRIVFVVEDEPLGDAGPLRYISEKYSLSDDVIVVYGDVYSEINYKEVLNYHQKENNDVTITATRVKDVRKYGVIYHKDGKLIKLVEKPDVAETNLINAGVYVFKKGLFKFINYPSSISKNLLPNLLKEGHNIGVYEYNGIWADIGFPNDYKNLNLILLERKYPKGFIDNSAKISESTHLEPPYYISKNVRIEGDSTINNSIIGANSKIGKGVAIRESILMNNVEVGDFSYIKGAIIADKCKIGKWNHLLEASILGEEVYTIDGILINENTLILPYKEITNSIVEKGKIIL
jgi:mannose-1-phosphate guanylyltransferase